MITELTFTVLKYAFLLLLWVFVWLISRSLYRDVATFSPRKSRASRRKERQARKKAEVPAPAAQPLRSPPSTASSNNVVLDDEFVSSHHARVYPDPTTDSWAIEDLHSTNGTVVNQQRINAPTILTPRVPVRIGATTFELR